jgi:hypothetical protein
MKCGAYQFRRGQLSNSLNWRVGHPFSSSQTSMLTLKTLEIAIIFETMALYA